jgi:hypothetical protein
MDWTYQDLESDLTGRIMCEGHIGDRLSMTSTVEDQQVEPVARAFGYGKGLKIIMLRDTVSVSE